MVYRGSRLRAVCETERLEVVASDQEVWTALRASPIAFPAGSELIGAGGSDVAFRLRSGWVSLTRTAPTMTGVPVLVGLAMPGDLVWPETMAAAGADAATCLGPVSVAAATTVALRRSAAGNPALGLWIAQQVADWRSWASCRIAPAKSDCGRTRVAALLTHVLGRLAGDGGEPIATFVLPLSLERVADLAAMDPTRFGDALQWLLDVRILSCVYPVTDSVVIGVADRYSLSSLASNGSASV